MIRKFKKIITGKNSNPKNAFSEDIFAAQQIQGLLSDSFYLPFSSSSLRYSSISVFLNDVIINGRKNIVEFGSGITTYVIAKLIQKNKLNDCKLYTIDENDNWISIIKSLLAGDGLENYVEFIYAPLEKTEMAISASKWYNTKILTERFSTLKIDSVLVDGPSAWHKEIQFSRYPAFAFAVPFLNDSAAIFLDDADRNGEKKIIKLWNQVSGMEFRQLNDSFVGFFKGNYFNILLQNK